MNFIKTHAILLLLLSGVLMILFNSYLEKRKTKKAILVAWDEFLEASVDSGTWLKNHRFENHDNAHYQWYLRREVDAFGKYLQIKRFPNKQETLLKHELSGKIVITVVPIEPQK